MKEYRVKRYHRDNQYWWYLQASVIGRNSWIVVCNMEGNVPLFSLKSDALKMASALQEQQKEEIMQRCSRCGVSYRGASYTHICPPRKNCLECKRPFYTLTCANKCPDCSTPKPTAIPEAFYRAWEEKTE